MATRMVSQMTSRSVPGISSGRTAPSSSRASRASQSTAPVTCSSWVRTRTSEVPGENSTPSSRACSRSSATISSSSSLSNDTMVAAPPPRRIAERAASEAVLPPPMTSTSRPTLTGRPSPASRRNSSAAADAAGLDPLDRQPLAHVLAEGQERRGIVAELVPADVLAGPGAGADLDAAQGQELGDLGVQDLLGQVPVRDPGPEHPARLVQRLEDHAAVPEAAQVIGGREAGRPGADDGDRGPVQRRAAWP